MKKVLAHDFAGDAVRGVAVLDAAGGEVALSIRTAPGLRKSILTMRPPSRLISAYALPHRSMEPTMACQKLTAVMSEFGSECSRLYSGWLDASSRPPSRVRRYRNKGSVDTASAISRTQAQTVSFCRAVSPLMRLPDHESSDQFHRDKKPLSAVPMDLRSSPRDNALIKLISPTNHPTHQDRAQ